MSIHPHNKNVPHNKEGHGGQCNQYGENRQIIGSGGNKTAGKGVTGRAHP
jgi:hypothetical protein